MRKMFFGALVTCVRESRWFLWLKRRIWLSLHQVAIPVLKLHRFRFVSEKSDLSFPLKIILCRLWRSFWDDFRTTGGGQHFAVVTNFFEGRDGFRTKKSTPTIFTLKITYSKLPFSLFCVCESVCEFFIKNGTPWHESRKSRNKEKRSSYLNRGGWKNPLMEKWMPFSPCFREKEFLHLSCMARFWSKSFLQQICFGKNQLCVWGKASDFQ